MFYIINYSNFCTQHISSNITILEEMYFRGDFLFFHLHESSCHLDK